jgi:uncharacterized membrane protein YcgQ (UPF0703/DUF1980 family)
MKYHGMEPAKHLEFMFNAIIEMTGQKRYLKEDLAVYHRQSYNEPTPQNMAVRTENEIAVKMGEGDYQNFMDSYGKYLELTYALERDPVAKDMFQKLMTYIILMR